MAPGLDRGSRERVLTALAHAVATVLVTLRPGADRIEARDAFDDALDDALNDLDRGPIEYDVGHRKGPDS